MNILLSEINCFEQIENKPINFGAHSLTVAFNLLNSRATQNTPEIQVYILAKKDSTYANLAKTKGLNVLLLPEGNFSRLKLVFLLRKYKFNIIHTFDVASAKIIAKAKGLLPKNICYIHSENRLTEENSVFASKEFAKVDSFVFTDPLFQRFYNPGLLDKKVHSLPIVLSEQAQLEETNKQEDTQEVTANLSPHEKFKLNLEYANEYTIKKDSGSPKARFLIPINFSEEYQHKEILQIIKAFDNETSYEWEAYFYGLGNELEQFLALAQELEIDKHFLTFISYENDDAFAYCDLCILNLPRDEYIINPLLKAWKHSIPVLTTTSISYFNPAKHNQNIYVADLNKKEAFVKAMHTLLDDSNLRSQLTRLGKNSYSSTLHLADAYYTFYKEQMKNKNT